MNHWETKKEKVEKLLKEAVVARLAMCVDDKPYLVPVNFGIGEGVLYFHSGNKGTKVEALTKNPQVAFEMDADVEVVRKEDACKWSMKYKSIVGTGKVVKLTDGEEKRKGLDRLMEHHAPGETFSYNEKMLAATNVYKVEIETLFYKESGTE